MATLTYQYNEGTQIAELQALKRKLGDFRAELRKGRENYARQVEAVFATEGASSGNPWQDLSPMRQRVRETQRSSSWAQHPILQWDYDLIDVATFKKTSGRKVSGSTTINRTDMELTIRGLKVDNQEGATYGKYTVPARPFWPWGPQEEDVFFQPFIEWADSQKP